METTDEIMVMGDLELNKSLLEFLTQKRIILHFFNYHESMILLTLSSFPI